MEALRTFLNSLPDEAAREAFAASCKTSLGHLRNCIYDKGKKLAAATCVRIEERSGGKVKRWSLRADWHEIWPELRSRKGAPPIPAAEAA